MNGASPVLLPSLLACGRRWERGGRKRTCASPFPGRSGNRKRYNATKGTAASKRDMNGLRCAVLLLNILTLVRLFLGQHLHGLEDAQPHRLAEQVTL